MNEQIEELNELPDRIKHLFEIVVKRSEDFINKFYQQQVDVINLKYETLKRAFDQSSEMYNKKKIEFEKLNVKYNLKNKKFDDLMLNYDQMKQQLEVDCIQTASSLNNQMKQKLEIVSNQSVSSSNDQMKQQTNETTQQNDQMKQQLEVVSNQIASSSNDQMKQVDEANDVIEIDTDNEIDNETNDFLK